MTYVAVIDSYDGVAIYDTVLTASVYTFQQIWDHVLIDLVSRVLHVFAVRRVLICFLAAVPVRIFHTWSVDDQTGISLHAAQLLIIPALVSETSLSACKDC